eukprot:3356565-Pleurochrysis_carterae.AAC.1
MAVCCQRCRASLALGESEYFTDSATSGARSQAPSVAPLGESYVVLPQALHAKQVASISSRSAASSCRVHTSPSFVFLSQIHSSEF